MNLNDLSSENISASYTRYTPGTGAGMGIDFFFEFEDSIPGVKVQRMVINDVEMEALTYMEDGQLKIKANRFYAGKRPSRDNPNPDPPEAPLYYASKYRAVLTLEKNGETKKFVISGFKENEPVLYP